MNNNHLIDNFGREMLKLRVSLLDSCNFKCSYCMPKGPEFLKYNGLLSPEEIFTITKKLNLRGIREIRLTGGEPTLRKDLVQIAQLLSTLDLDKLGMTTNAFHLENLLPDLSKTKLRSLNISLDSLDRVNFYKITKSDSLERVLRAIFRAKDLDFHIKLNCVLMRGVNDHEVEKFVNFSAENNIEVRFLELMKVGVVVDNFDELFIPSDEIISSMNRTHLLKKVQVSKDSTSYKFRLDNEALIGFISSESKSFCNSCSRLRLDSKGFLRSCLMQEDGLNIRDISDHEFDEKVKTVINMKPYERIEKISQPMYQIGG